MDCATVHHGPTVIHMASTVGGDSQRFLAMSIRAEASARGWTLTELSERAGIDYQSLLRKLNQKRHFTLGEVGQVADALGMPLSELVADSERRRDRQPPNPDPDIHPDDAALIDSSDKLTKRQRAQLKRALSGEDGTAHLSYMRNPGESVESSERRPRRAGSA